MGGHHLILGELIDRITGRHLPDTHDERYRQKIAGLLLDEKGYRKAEIQSRLDLILKADAKRALIKVDFLIQLSDRPAMLVKYGPGSMVTRRRPSLAAARLLTPYQIPIVVVTNGEDAEILDGATGKVNRSGLEAIPSRAKLVNDLKAHVWAQIKPQRAEMESRIAFCYEIDGACPCDDTICHL
jgi:hypothetical protein